MKKIIFLKYLLILIILISCKTHHPEINYMKNIEEVALTASKENAKTTIESGDQLVILISAKDMDVVKPFNQNYSSGQVVQYSIPSNNTPSASQTTVSGPTYVVDSNGFIDFPIIGKISTENKTIEEFKQTLKNHLTRFIKDPIVIVRNTNFKVVVLGEVQKPGTYHIPDANPTIWSALGMAGDLTMYGVRNNVLIVRNNNGETTKQLVDLTDANFMNSPYFHLKQNDVIYVSANQVKQKTSRFDPNTGTYLTAASILASVITTILVIVLRK